MDKYLFITENDFESKLLNKNYYGLSRITFPNDDKQSPIYLEFFESLVTMAEYKTEVISEIIDFHTANQFSNKKIVTYFKVSNSK